MRVLKSFKGNSLLLLHLLLLLLLLSSSIHRTAKWHSIYIGSWIRVCMMLTCRWYRCARNTKQPTMLDTSITIKSNMYRTNEKKCRIRGVYVVWHWSECKTYYLYYIVWGGHGRVGKALDPRSKGLEFDSHSVGQTLKNAVILIITVLGLSL